MLGRGRQQPAVRAVLDVERVQLVGKRRAVRVKVLLDARVVARRRALPHVVPRALRIVRASGKAQRGERRKVAVRLGERKGAVRAVRLDEREQERRARGVVRRARRRVRGGGSRVRRERELGERTQL